MIGKETTWGETTTSFESSGVIAIPSIQVPEWDEPEKMEVSGGYKTVTVTDNGYPSSGGKYQRITIHLTDNIDTGDYNTQINCSSNHPLPVINALIDRLEELRETFKSQL